MIARLDARTGAASGEAIRSDDDGRLASGRRGLAPPVSRAGLGWRPRSGGGREPARVVEAAMDARAETLDVGAVDVHRDRELVAGGGNRVDIVGGRHERLDVAGMRVDASGRLQAALP